MPAENPPLNSPTFVDTARAPSRVGTAEARAQFVAWRATAKDGAVLTRLPVFTRAELPALLARVRALGDAVAV